MIECTYIRYDLYRYALGPSPWFQAMRRRLRESISSAMAEDFRHSADPIDQQLWRLRSEECTFQLLIFLRRFGLLDV